MRSRAVLLPFPGDPFLLHYWLKLYKRVWSTEIDKLYIFHNSAIQPDVEEYIKKLCEEYGAHYIYFSEQIEHGAGLRILLEACTEENVMLIEDDAFIFRSGVVNRLFSVIEENPNNIVCSKRGSCSDEISETAKNLWNLDYSGMADQGCNFWPCYFFCNKQVLLDTDRWFGAKGWSKGDYIEPLNHTVISEQIAGDTFVWTSLQLRAKNYNFVYVPQYHGSPDDMEHYQKGYNLWNGVCWWTHVGSLSSGIGGVLTDNNGFSLSKKGSGHPLPIDLERQKPKTLQEKNEWERRIQWWKTFHDNRDIEAIKDFADEYIMAINKIIAIFELNPAEIRRRQNIYRELGL